MQGIKERDKFRQALNKWEVMSKIKPKKIRLKWTEEKNNRSKK